MSNRVITAFFDDDDDANKAIISLTEAGIPRAQIRKTPENFDTTGTADRPHEEKGFWASLSDFFLPDDDRNTYAEAMKRGSIMVSATVDAAHAEKAEDILEEYGTVNIDERAEGWKKEGWTGYTGTDRMDRPASPTALKPAMASGNASEDVIEVVEEELKIGKRVVNDGRVKVRSYVVETPVSEQVNLRTESVHVQQRAVDRPIAAGEDMFTERTIEAQAMSEEAIVSKTARVTGEVVVTKDVGERVEQVSDTVRSTKVEIDEGDARVAKPVLDRR